MSYYTESLCPHCIRWVDNDKLEKHFQICEQRKIDERVREQKKINKQFKIEKAVDDAWEKNR